MRVRVSLNFALHLRGAVKLQKDTSEIIEQKKPTQVAPFCYETAFYFSWVGLRKSLRYGRSASNFVCVRAEQFAKRLPFMQYKVYFERLSPPIRRCSVADRRWINWRINLDLS